MPRSPGYRNARKNLRKTAQAQPQPPQENQESAEPVSPVVSAPENAASSSSSEAKSQLWETDIEGVKFRLENNVYEFSVANDEFFAYPESGKDGRETVRAAYALRYEDEDDNPDDGNVERISKTRLLPGRATVPHLQEAIKHNEIRELIDDMSISRRQKKRSLRYLLPYLKMDKLTAQDKAKISNLIYYNHDNTTTKVSGQSFFNATNRAKALCKAYDHAHKLGISPTNVSRDALVIIHERIRKLSAQAAILQETLTLENFMILEQLQSNAEDYSDYPKLKNKIDKFQEKLDGEEDEDFKNMYQQALQKAQNDMTAYCDSAGKTEEEIQQALAAQQENGSDYVDPTTAFADCHRQLISNEEKSQEASNNCYILYDHDTCQTEELLECLPEQLQEVFDHIKSFKFYPGRFGTADVVEVDERKLEEPFEATGWDENEVLQVFGLIIFAQAYAEALNINSGHKGCHYQFKYDKKTLIETHSGRVNLLQQVYAITRVYPQLAQRFIDLAYKTSTKTDSENGREFTVIDHTKKKGRFINCAFRVNENLKSFRKFNCVSTGSYPVDPTRLQELEASYGPDVRASQPVANTPGKKRKSTGARSSTGKKEEAESCYS